MALETYRENLKEHFAMAQFVFWAATIGGCAAWTAIGYVLARLI
jgi:hypothetical protein